MIISLIIAVIVAIILVVAVEKISPDAQITWLLRLVILLGFIWYVARLFKLV